MSSWALLHFFAFVTNLYAGLYLLYRNPRALLNRLAAGVLMCFAVWSIGITFIRNSWLPLETARIINNITSIGWLSFSSVFIAFALEFAARGNILRRPIVVIPLILFPLGFTLLQLDNRILGYLLLKPYGWVGMWTESIWTALYLIYYLTATGIGLAIIWHFRTRTDDRQRKKQSLTLIVSVLISLVAGTLTSVVLRLFNVYWIPPLGDVTVLAWTAGLFYATVRYRLFEFTPSAAAEEILDTMTEALLLVGPTGSIVTVNAAATALLGAGSSADCVGRDILTLFPRDARDAIVRALYKTSFVSNLRSSIFSLDGREIPVLLSSTALSDEGGRVQGYVCVIRDFTDIKAAEERLMEARDVAEQANRAKSTFLATMSHEMRTPLNAVLGYTRLLRADAHDVDTTARLEYIERSGEQLLALINEMLDFAKIESGTMQLSAENFSLRAMLEDIERTFALRAEERRLGFSVCCAEDVPATVRGAGVRLRQVVSNLVENAIKFTERGSVSVSCIYDSGAAFIEVVDTGPGIGADERQAIFEPFRQVDMSHTRAHGGIGLGLAICGRLVGLMGGVIEVGDGPEGGARFSVSVPLTPLETPEVTADREAPVLQDLRAGTGVSAALDSGTCIALVADDNDLVRNLIGSILARLGVSHAFAENGAQAIEMLRRAPYRLLIMDIQMPEMDGMEAIRRIRADEALRDIYAIALTAHALEDDARRFLDAGFNDYISKPVDFPSFIGMVKRALGG
ncbi:MAG TPA: ATP-binding protein [Spirochaetota bacterium]|nr:ATP-binding protein [Spirochaetota bacterium]